jgi:predicted Zn-dependent peptidase
MKRLACIALLVIGIATPGQRSLAQEIHEFTLDNGLRVIVNPVDEATDVAVESFYRVGFIHEPKGMVQSAHLLEHLVCYAPGAGLEQKKAMDWLNEVGMANAETMPDFTHYDYAVPSSSLEKVLQIEAARLQQESFDRSLLIAEAKRVYQETAFVENNPAAGMLKHAFMSLSHAWKYGAEQTLVGGGLEEFELDRLQSFYDNHYYPANATLLITGKTTVEDTQRLVEKHFGQIPEGEPEEAIIDWSVVPPKQTVRWDSCHSAVCIAWKPPADEKQQLLLSIIGLGLLQRANAESKLKARCELVMTSTNSWHVGELPFFLYAMAKADEELSEIDSLFASLMDDSIDGIIQSGPQMAKAIASSYEMQLKPLAWARAQKTAAFLRNRGKTETQSLQQTLLHDAYTRGSIYHFLGDDPKAGIELMRNATVEDFRNAIEQNLTEENKSTVHIVPMDK